MEALIMLALLGGLCYGGYKLGMMVFFPQIYLEEKRQKHEREMETRARNRQVMGLAGTLARMFFGR